MSSKSIWDIAPENAEEPQTNHVIETTSIPSSSIRLHNNVLKGCQDCGLSKPNRVQLQVLSHFSKLSYQNLVINTPPRSGKTSSAIIGILDNLSRATCKYSLALIMCPTYEIAEISYSCCQVLAKHCDVSLHFIAKGKRIDKELKCPKEIVIGAPDKILDLSRTSELELKKASFIVIDEADCLGNPKKFFSDLSQIFQKLSPKCRSILCTVTKNRDIEDFITKHIDLPIEISISNTVYRQFQIKQFYLVCSDEKEKLESLTVLINMPALQGKVVVFTETKEVANRLGLHLHKNDIFNELLIGDLSVTQRKKVVEDFKTDNVQVLITTRSFVSIIPASCATKLIHYDQILDEKDRLNTNVYSRREYLLSNKHKCLIAYYIDKRWEEYLFRDKDVTNDKSFFNQIEIISNQNLAEYLCQM